MIQYFCNDCNVPMETSECSICKKRTELSSTVYWCDKCNIPIYWDICPCCGEKGRYVSTDIRPVFPKESLLIGIILDEKNPLALQKSSVWNGSGSYIIDGKKISISSTKLNSLPLEEIIKIKRQYDLYVDQIDMNFFDKVKRKFVEINRVRYDEINDEGIRYIGSFLDKYSIDEMFVSFSGGKDSTVVSHLVTKALGSRKILHIFGDTTLEHDLTYEYKKRFLKNEETVGIPMISARNNEKTLKSYAKLWDRLAG